MGESDAITDIVMSTGIATHTDIVQLRGPVKGVNEDGHIPPLEVEMSGERTTGHIDVLKEIDHTSVDHTGETETGKEMQTRITVVGVDLCIALGEFYKRSF